MDEIIALNRQLLDAVRREGFAGYDPFDLLNSRLLQSSLFYGNEWLRLAWLQLGKRSPINFRPVLGVPKRRNPKGIALFILGLLQDYRRTSDTGYLREARELADWLLTQRSDPRHWTHACWGYHFDWQARAFFVPAGKPNIITTCYVARALYDLGQLTADQTLSATALDTARFISSHLYTQAEGRRFYAYIPGERAFVHNASLWGAAWCAFCGKQLGDEALITQAMDVARQSVQEQSDDGSWVYGARRHHRFIDGFHTGYNLEAIHLLRDATGTREFDCSLRQGYTYYVNNFFTANGTAKYYHNAVYPLDMHSFAQAVFTLLKVGGTPADRQLCDKVVQRAVILLYLPAEHRFIYRKTRWLTNPINYTRWTQAWAYYALAFYNRYRGRLYHAQN